MAMSLANPNDYVDLPASPGASTFVGDRTFAFWARIDDFGATEPNFLTQRGDTPNVDTSFGNAIYSRQSGLGGPKGIYFFACNSSGQFKYMVWTNQPLLVGWHHHVITSDGGLDLADTTKHKWYLDGVEITIGRTISGSATGTVRPDVLNWRMAHELDTDQRAGFTFADMCVWNRIVSADQIAALYAGFSGLCFPNELIMAVPAVADFVDRTANGTITINGSPTKADHPPIIYPADALYSIPSSAPGLMPMFQKANLGNDLFNGSLL